MADDRDSKTERQARLAEALRANLRRRKRQARGRAAHETDRQVQARDGEPVRAARDVAPADTHDEGDEETR